MCMELFKEIFLGTKMEKVKIHYLLETATLHNTNFEKLIGTNVLPLWFFYPDKENVTNTLRIANSLKYSEIIKSKIMRDDTVLEMPHSKWYGCFGAQSFINFNFLNSL